MRASPPPLDCDLVTADVLRVIAGAAPKLEPLARRHLDRLTPERWTIEWYLPAWLGRRFDLDRGCVDGLTRANVLGMLSIRLQDDLEDGDVDPAEVADARTLARLAFEVAVGEYHQRFDAASPIWAFLERSMVEWRAGASGHDLEVRGGPVKIAALACCLEAGNLDVWPSLERCLDRAVTALVLYDQFCDWEADVRAGRWNAFVARITPEEQVPSRRERTRAAVLTALLTTRVAADHFDAMARAGTEAASLAAELELADLSEFLRLWVARASEQGAQVAVHYRRLADQAFSLFVGTRVKGAAT